MPRPRYTPTAYTTDVEQTNEPPSVFYRELNFLRNANHPNIIRFIDIERVIASDNSITLPGPEVLIMEYCNGGSVGDMLQLPANRYGLCEDIVMLIIKDVISALKYLHTRRIIHRDIKPDNIMQSIDVNGKVTFKLADLGVARQINPGELTSDSIRGTEQYVHPGVYCAAFPDTKKTVEERTVGTPPQFRFEVEMWSFGVTIYQCATGKIPFEPFRGARSDREAMRAILTSIPKDCISGIQRTLNGGIQWSKTLPDWCRLSPTLKKMLEKLLSRLFETDQDRLMTHKQFFDEIDKILNLIPVYYINLKRFRLTCAYCQPDDPIDKLFDQIRQENGDGIHVDYHCLFQNVFYPVSKTKRITVKAFCDELPIQTSREKPLVVYTFSSLKFDLKYVSNVYLPEIQSIESGQNFLSPVHDWSKNITGLFFYLKKQLMDYESIIEITQSSIVTMHRYLETKLLELLSSVREKLIDYQTSHELEKRSNQIESKNNPTTVFKQAVVDGQNSERQSPKIIRSHKGSIIRPFPVDDVSPPIDDVFSQQTTTSSSDEQNLPKIGSILRSSPDLYHQLIHYEKELSKILKKNFSDPLTLIPDLSQKNSNYSSHIKRIDKYAADATDLNETFRQDATLPVYGPLQMTYHVIRRKQLLELHETYIRYINESCYPLILEIFNEFSKLIKQQADINQELQCIQYFYNNQNIPIESCRPILGNELPNMGTINVPLSSDPHPPSTGLEHNQDQLANLEQSSITNNPNTISISTIHHTNQNIIEQAENISSILDYIIEQLRARTIR